MMKKNELYEAPETKVLELRLEGVIAVSSDYNSPFDPEQDI